jgi:hypothetical protein
METPECERGEVSVEVAARPCNGSEIRVAQSGGAENVRVVGPDSVGCADDPPGPFRERTFANAQRGRWLTPQNGRSRIGIRFGRQCRAPCERAVRVVHVRGSRADEDGALAQGERGMVGQKAAQIAERAENVGSPCPAPSEIGHVAVTDIPVEQVSARFVERRLG